MQVPQAGIPRQRRRAMTDITLAQAQDVMTAAIEEARELNTAMDIAVVDEGPISKRDIPWIGSTADGEAMDKATDLIERHVDLFNHGVDSGDFVPMLEHFEHDATLAFRGIPVGPFHGKATIVAAYKAQPPTDQVDVLRIGTDGDI